LARYIGGTFRGRLKLQNAKKGPRGLSTQQKETLKNASSQKNDKATPIRATQFLSKGFRAAQKGSLLLRRPLSLDVKHLPVPKLKDSNQNMQIRRIFLNRELRCHFLQIKRKGRKALHATEKKTSLHNDGGIGLPKLTKVREKKGLSPKEKTSHL